MSISKINTSKLMKHVPEKLDGRQAVLSIAATMEAFQEYEKLSSEEQERMLYEALKKKYEKET